MNFIYLKVNYFYYYEIGDIFEWANFKFWSFVGNSKSDRIFYQSLNNKFRTEELESPAIPWN